MIYVAEVKDGIVTRVVVSDSDIEGWITVGPENTVGIGWAYVDGEFIAPVDGDE